MNVSEIITLNEALPDGWSMVRNSEGLWQAMDPDGTVRASGRIRGTVMGQAERYAASATPRSTTPSSSTRPAAPGERVWTARVDDAGNMEIEFEDGTKFKVLSAEALKVYEEWDYYDHLSVTPNVMPMGGSEYYITNHDKDDDFVHANFLDKPYGNSDYTQFINHIDKHEGRVSIFNENGNEFWWMIEPKDLSKAEKWHEKDRVIIGKNDVWIETFYTDCQYIMINLDCSHLPHIRISPLYNND